MKKQDFQDLKNKPKGELEKQLSELRERLRVLRFDLAGGKVKNVREIRKVKKETAQIMTLLNKDKND